MNNSREKFEEALNNCVLETQCMLEYDETTTRDIAHFIWQAARAIDAKRIAELEDLLDEQRGAIRGLNMCIGGEDSLTTNNLRACGEYLDNEKCLLEMVRELQAREKVLVEALEACKYDCNTGEIIGIARDALANVNNEKKG